MKKSTEPIFESLRFTQIATGEARELQLEQQPAIYAWYRSLRIGDSVGSPEAFIEKLQQLLSAKLSDKFSGRLGYLYEIIVQEGSGGLTKKKQRLLEEISKSLVGREKIADILESSTFLQSPLYVGKALDLRIRVGEHVTGASGLSNRLLAADILIEQCILRYRYIEEQEINEILLNTTGTKESVVLLIEEILTRLSPASFVRRPG